MRAIVHGEEVGEGEAFVKEKADGEQGRAGVAYGYVEEIGAGRVEDEGGDVVVGDGEAGGDGGSNAGTVGDDVFCREGA